MDSGQEINIDYDRLEPEIESDTPTEQIDGTTSNIINDRDLTSKPFSETHLAKLSDRDRDEYNHYFRNEDGESRDSE